MAGVAGIQFGNTNSCIAICKDGRIDIVSNDAGDRVTPSMVAYTGDEKVVGLPAKQYWQRTPKSVVWRMKSTIGKSCAKEEAQAIVKKCENCTIHIQGMSLSLGSMLDTRPGTVRGEGGIMSYQVVVDDKVVKVNPEEAAMYVMTKLLVDAETVGGNELEDAVIAVPCSFTEKQRIALSEAAEEAGFNILRVITEPAAALLAHDIGQDKSSDVFTALTFRLGGSSCEAALVEVNSGTYRIIHHERNPHCGGEVVDDLLVEMCAQAFQRDFKMNVRENSRAMRRLTNAAQQCKHTLSTSTSTACSAESLHEGVDFNTNITRAKFESLANPVFKECFALVGKLLKATNCSKESIAKVVLFGGGVKIPKVQTMFKEYFSESDVIVAGNPDEILAQGAAIEAGILQGKEDAQGNDSHFLDCLPRHICFETFKDGKRCLVPLIEKMTPVPTKKTSTFECTQNESSICIRLFESEAIGECDDAVCLGKIVLRNLSKPDLCLSFVAEYKRDGSLRVLVEERTNRVTEVLVLEPGA